MDNFFKNIIPRLKKYSQELGKKEVFIDKPWLFADEKNNNHEYLFMRDNRLIMSLNGTATTGSWELLPNGKLLINRVQDQVMLENMFIDEALMILKLSGSDESAFVLVNPTLIPDLDAQRYLKAKEQEKRNEDEEKLLGTTQAKLIESGILIGSFFYPGQSVISFDGSIVTGEFKTSNKEFNQFAIIENGIIKSCYYHVMYRLKNNTEKKIIIHQNQAYEITKGDKIVQFVGSDLEPLVRIELIHPLEELYTVISNENGIITKVINKAIRSLINVVILIILLVTIIGILAALS